MKEKMTRYVGVLLTPTDFSKIQKEAARLGLGMSAWFRMSVIRATQGLRKGKRGTD